MNVQETVAAASFTCLFLFTLLNFNGFSAGALPPTSKCFSVVNFCTAFGVVVVDVVVAAAIRFPMRFCVFFICDNFGKLDLVLAEECHAVDCGELFVVAIDFDDDDDVDDEEGSLSFDFRCNVVVAVAVALIGGRDSRDDSFPFFFSLRTQFP